MPSLSFANSKTYVASGSLSGHALIAVQLVVAGHPTMSVDCVVDTGSAYTILPLALARSAGIVPNGPRITISTISGTTAGFVSHTVDLLIAGSYAVPNCQILFSAASGFVPIIGIQDLNNAFDFAFEFSQWHYG